MAHPDEQTRKQCSHCGKPARYGLEPYCRACRYPIAQWAPNVELAGQTAQVAALEERYRAAREKAERESTIASQERLQRLADQTVAVVNAPVGMAHDLFFREDLLYSPYEAQVRAVVRSPADFEHDRRRRAVGDLLYASWGAEIVYAALCVDGAGLTSYGQAHLELEEVTIAYRASVLEENSYRFIERHGLTPAKPLPIGYLAVWGERGKLAVAKLVERLQPELDDQACCALLLESCGNRSFDLFLEVHIYGNFNYQAVRCVGLPDSSSAVLNEVQAVQVKALLERLQTLAVPWRKV
jgi:hypothetical protein